MAGEEHEFVVVRVDEGEVAGENWVYTWIDADRVVYVGATGLDPRTRVWLHLNDPDPDVGRIRARFDGLSTATLEVLAMRVPEAIPRAEVRDVLGARLAEEGLLRADAITDHLQLPLESSPETYEVVERYVARLRSHLGEQGARAPLA